MNTENNGDFDTLIEKKIEEDTGFQDSLVDLEDDERGQAIKEKREEVIKQEWQSLSETAKKEAELAKNYKTRAEKAEAEAKKLKPAEKEINNDNPELSSKDIYTLINAQIPQEDVDEVLKAAKILNKPIHEALKDDVVKTILSNRKEYRATAEATNTKNARPGIKKTTDDELISKASKGEVPEKGSSEAEQLFWAKRGGKR